MPNGVEAVIPGAGGPRRPDRTRSLETEKVYELRVRRFTEWVKRRRIAMEWQSLAVAYEALTRELAPASRRQYRAALRFWIERHIGLIEAELWTARAALIDKAWRARKKKAGGTASGGRGGLLKLMPEAERRLIAAALYGRGTIYGLLAGDLILATPIVGLRPMEWATATLEGDRLTVVNAKYKEGVRGNGPRRTLIVDFAAMKVDEAQAIVRLVGSMSGRSWSSLRPNLQPVLKTVIASLVSGGHIAKRWKRLRFYDARHQFSAELKASLDAGKGEVAAGMGHASAMTAVQHYGRRRNAQRPSAVRPTAESVAAVKEKTIQRLNRRLAEPRRAAPERTAPAERHDSGFRPVKDE